MPTCDAIHYLRLLGADCSKFGMLKCTISCRKNMVVYILYNSTERNKFEENRAAALAEDVNNGDIKDENLIDENATVENGDCIEKVDGAETD